MTMDSSKSILNVASIFGFIYGIPMMIIGILGLTGTSIASQVPGFLCSRIFGIENERVVRKLMV